MSYSTFELLTTGILMGFVYVLTGPDHLCALATLVGTSSNKQSWSILFVLGVKWGLGSAVSLFVVGTLLLLVSADENDDNSGDNEWIIMNDTTSMILDGFVGVYMLCLGCYGLLKAIQHRNTNGASSSMQQHQLPGESIELNINSNSNRSAAAPRRSSSNLDKVNEAASDNDNSDDEDASFLENRRASTDIIHQMSVVLNRDGDSMRDSNSDSGKFDPADAADVERRILAAAKSLRQNSNLSSSSSRHSPSGSPSSSQLLKRRPSSLRSQNSTSPKQSQTTSSSPATKMMMPRSNSLEIDEMEEQQLFTNTLKASAKGALSNSFLSILKDEHRSSSTTPMRASDFTRKHAAPEHSIILERHDEDSSIITRASRLSGRLLCCCCGCCFTSACPTLQPGMLALITGIVQGISGAASILGVIPLVELKHLTSFAIYTITVSITSILVMAMFTVCYGTFISLLAGFGTSSSRGGGGRSSSSSVDIDGYNNRVYVLEGGSAILSIVCGIIWLALLSVGRVQEL